MIQQWEKLGPLPLQETLSGIKWVKIRKTYSEKLNDEVSENTLKKRREYYRKHGVMNVFPPGLGSSLGEDIENDSSLSYNDGGGEDMSNEREDDYRMTVEDLIEDMKQFGLTADDVIAGLMDAPKSWQNSLEEDVQDPEDIEDEEELDGIELLYWGKREYLRMTNNRPGSVQRYYSLYREWRKEIKRHGLDPEDKEAFERFLRQHIEETI